MNPPRFFSFVATALFRAVPLVLVLASFSLPALGQKPSPKQAIINPVVQNAYPAVRFRFATTVPVTPVIYLLSKSNDYQHINPRDIVGRKSGLFGTVHDLRITPPKGDKGYYALIIAGPAAWEEQVYFSSPKKY